MRIAKILIAIATMLANTAQALDSAEYVVIPAGKLASVLASDADTGPTLIPAFAIRATPVTNEEYLEFVKAHRDWRRGRAPLSFADGTYLHTWRSPFALGIGMNGNQPVTNVSWFAAEAFCESEQARLPTWLEWNTSPQPTRRYLTRAAIRRGGRASCRGIHIRPPRRCLSSAAR